MTRVPRLLLVDDSEADLYLLEAALEQHGEALDIALQTLQAAMKGKTSAEAARLAFIAAAHEAGLEIKE